MSCLVTCGPDILSGELVWSVWVLVPVLLVCCKKIILLKLKIKAGQKKICMSEMSCDQHLFFCYIGHAIPLLPKSEIYQIVHQRAVVKNIELSTRG